MLGLLDLQVDLDFLVELIVSFEDREHRIIEQATFKVRLTSSFLC